MRGIAVVLSVVVLLGCGVVLSGYLKARQIGEAERRDRAGAEGCYRLAFTGLGTATGRPHQHAPGVVPTTLPPR